MNTIFLRKGVFWLVGLTAVTVLGSGASAVAQTATESQTAVFPDVTTTEAETKNENVSIQTPVKSSAAAVKPTAVSNLTQNQQFPTAATGETASIITPVPGTVATSSAAFDAKTADETSAPTTVAQADILPVNPGRATRGGSSYVGIAGNIGLGGDSALGDGNFMVISKIGLTNAISVRPSVVLGDNTTILLPVSYDFSFQSLADPFTEPLPIAPYVGAGVAIETGDGADIAFLITGGVDVPINRRFTATAAVNAAFLDETDLGLSVGVGYNFRGL